MKEPGSIGAELFAGDRDDAPEELTLIADLAGQSQERGDKPVSSFDGGRFVKVRGIPHVASHQLKSRSRVTVRT